MPFSGELVLRKHECREGTLCGSPYSCFLSHASQVIQQALHRQPSTAAQYLQQMYAAQQQHLMLQTAALQQQHLSSAQLQSLAAVQQVRGGLTRAPGLFPNLWSNTGVIREETSAIAQSPHKVPKQRGLLSHVLKQVKDRYQGLLLVSGISGFSPTGPATAG